MADASAVSSTVSEPSAPAEVVAGDGELPGLRTASSRTFQVKRGGVLVREARLWTRSVNFRDGGGAWQKIDDTLAAGGGGGLAPVASGVGVRLPGRWPGSRCR